MLLGGAADGGKRVGGNPRPNPSLRSQRSNPAAPQPEKLDCFAALAMTTANGALECLLQLFGDRPLAEIEQSLHPANVKMAVAHNLLRWRWFFVGASCVFGTFWITSEFQFRILQANVVQHRLFGKQIASWWTLQRALNGCCAWDSSGILEWTYALPKDQADDLAKRCRDGRGLPLSFTDVRTPYFDNYTKRCIVARVFDTKNAEDLTAEVAGQMLTVRLFYMDPDLIDANSIVWTARDPSVQ